jgi:hypothetical protein
MELVEMLMGKTLATETKNARAPAIGEKDEDTRCERMRRMSNSGNKGTGKMVDVWKMVEEGGIGKESRKNTKERQEIEIPRGSRNELIGKRTFVLIGLGTDIEALDPGTRRFDAESQRRIANATDMMKR